MRRLALLAVLVAGLLAAAPAEAKIWLTADATMDRGWVRLMGVATTDITTGVFGEVADDTWEHIATSELAYWRDHPEHGPIGFKILDRAVRWRCDRLDRDFTIAGRNADGIVEAAFFSVRTPSCRNRLTLTVPERIKTGGRLRAVIRDTWGTGLTRARVCFLDACRDIALADGQTEKVMWFRAGFPGVRRVFLKAPAQSIKVPIGVGVRAPARAASGPTVLTTGDSLMQNVDAILSDRLARKAKVITDVHLGSGLTKVTTVRWPDLARKQVAEHHPHAVAIFMGTNDVYAMATPQGRTVECCGDAWTEEYARRARQIMRIYAQGGAGTVAWLTVPAARDERRNPAATAVNKALRRAAVGLSTVDIVPVDHIFTPGMRYRETITHNGRTVVARESDGIHLSIAGAKITATEVIAILRRSGVLG